MSRLARLSRAAGIVLAFATQRPDVSFLPGETKANLGTRVLYLGDGDSTMCAMVLDRLASELTPLTANSRGRCRVLVGGGDPVETQGAFVTVAEVKNRAGVLPPYQLDGPSSSTSRSGGNCSTADRSQPRSRPLPGPTRTTETPGPTPAMTRSRRLGPPA